MDREIEIALLKQHDFLLWALAMHPKEMEKWKEAFTKFEELY